MEVEEEEKEEKEEELTEVPALQKGKMQRITNHYRCLFITSHDFSLHSIYFINTTFFLPEPNEIEVTSNKNTTLCL